MTGTGAFSSITAERSAEVSVAEDANAYLAMEPAANSPNGEGGYASQTSSGELALDFTGDYAADNGGGGVNANAVTDVDRVFNITNQGTQPVAVWVEDGGVSEVMFYQDADGTTIEDSSNAATVAPGETVQVSVEFDTTSLNASAGQIMDSVTVNANASEA